MRKVLFLCIHNTARSVIAESIFNSIAKEWIAESAGIKRGDKIDEVVREILAERGLKVRGSPRTIKDINVDDFDLIIKVCEEGKCPILPTLKPVESWNVEDPAGRDKDAYIRVYKEIEKKVRELVQKLEGRL